MARGKRRRAEIESEVHAALAHFAAAVEVRLHAELDRSRRTQVELIEALQVLRSDLAGRDAEFARALETVGKAVDYAADRIEAEGLERRALVEAVGSLGQALTGAPVALPAMPPLLPRERLLGGRVLGGRSAAGAVTETSSEPDTRPESPPETDAPVRAAVDEPATVQCLVNGHWEDGFEVLQILKAGDIVQYRVRRRLDGSVLEHLLDANEVRPQPPNEVRPQPPNEVRPQPAPPPTKPESSARPPIYWTRS
jgi:hypothetical protein